MIASSLQNGVSLLIDVRAYEVIESSIEDGDDSFYCRLAAKAASSGHAELLPPDHGIDGVGSAIAIPIHVDNRVGSVAVIAISPPSVGTGVFEIWEPIGIYQEVKLRDAYYANLERFSNVSSFVRFEKGCGLPGQAWSAARPVIHDDLPNHPGFLRAAGASAGLLKTAVAFPVMDGPNLISVAAMIGSEATPIAKGYEVWVANQDTFVLESAAYQGLTQDAQIPLKSTSSFDEGLPALATRNRVAVVTDDATQIRAGRTGACELITRSLVLPFFHGDSLTSATALLF